MNLPNVRHYDDDTSWNDHRIIMSSDDASIADKSASKAPLTISDIDRKTDDNIIEHSSNTIGDRTRAAIVPEPLTCTGLALLPLSARSHAHCNERLHNDATKELEQQHRQLETHYQRKLKQRETLIKREAKREIKILLKHVHAIIRCLNNRTNRWLWI